MINLEFLSSEFTVSDVEELPTDELYPTGPALYIGNVSFENGPPIEARTFVGPQQKPEEQLIGAAIRILLRAHNRSHTALGRLEAKEAAAEAVLQAASLAIQMDVA